MPDELPLGEVAALISAAAWAATSLLIRSLSDRLTPLTINLLRSVGAFLFTVCLVLAVRPSALAEGFSLDVFPFLLLSVVLAPGLGDTLFFESLRLIGVARAMPLAGTNPLFATIFAVMFLGEQVTPQFAAGTLLVILGVWLVAARAGVGRVRDARRGVILALAAAALWGLGTAAVAPALHRVDLLSANTIRLALTALTIGLFGWRTGGFNLGHGFGPRALVVIVLIGLVSAVSSMMFLVGVQLAGAARAAALSASAPLWSAPLALLIYREPLTRRLVLGTLVSVVGIALVVGR